MIIKINTPLTTLNEYIDAERKNKYIASKIKKSNTQRVLSIVRGLKLEPVLYDVHFNWQKPNNRQDHDNIAFAKKFILDGLVLAGVIPNDNPRYINNFTDKFTLCKDFDYVWCIVRFKEVI